MIKHLVVALLLAHATAFAQEIAVKAAEQVRAGGPAFREHRRAPRLAVEWTGISRFGAIRARAAIAATWTPAASR